MDSNSHQLESKRQCGSSGLRLLEGLGPTRQGTAPFQPFILCPNTSAFDRSA